VVGDTGYYVPYADAEAAAEAITEALLANQGAVVRNRIIGVFQKRIREERLIQIVESLREGD
jgi:hypothetical protein